MEIYNDILRAIKNESNNTHEVRPTRIQHRSNLAYDKFSKYLAEMRGRGLIVKRSLSITDRGSEFLKDYGRINRFTKEIGSKYLGHSTSVTGSANYRPIRFLDRISEKSHLVLLSDKKEYGDLVMIRYLAKGLESEESCIVLTFEDPRKVERDLAATGIDPEMFKEKSRLRIYRIEQPDVSKKSLNSHIMRVVRESTRGMKPPYRVFGNFLLVMKSMSFEPCVLVEQLIHHHFKHLDISLMCRYDLGDMDDSVRKKFVEGLLRHHNNVIYASSPRKAVGFDLSLLGEEE